MLLLDLILILLGARLVYSDDYCFADITISSKFDDSFQNIHFSGLYSLESETNDITGILIMPHYSSSNYTSNDSNGCLPYSNENLSINYISIVDQGECSIEEKISNALKSNALGLIIISENSQIFKIKNSKNNPLVVVTIKNEIGGKLKTLLKTIEIYVSIKPKSCESREFYIESQFNYQRLSYVSIWFIVVGNLCLLVLLGGSCTIFYIVQKTRLIEERERMNRLIDRLTKRAISKMKCKKVRPNDKYINEVCVICMENYKPNDNVRVLPCSHVFHKDEIDQWMNENKTCPVCKIDILRYYGIEIEARKNIFVSILQRLRILQSNQEISEAILAHQNRRDTIYSIHADTARRISFFSNGLSNNNELTINSIEQRNSVYAEFHRNHLKSFSLDDIDELKETRANSEKRLTFFGEKNPPNQMTDKIQIIIQNDDQQNTTQESITEPDANLDITNLFPNPEQSNLVLFNANDTINVINSNVNKINNSPDIEIKL